MEFMYLVFTRMPGESYVFRALINSLVCWFCTSALGLFLFQFYDNNNGYLERLTHTHARTHTQSRISGQWDWRKGFWKEKGFQRSCERTDKGSMTDGNWECSPLHTDLPLVWTPELTHSLHLGRDITSPASTNCFPLAKKGVIIMLLSLLLLLLMMIAFI